MVVEGRVGGTGERAGEDVVGRGARQLLDPHELVGAEAGGPELDAVRIGAGDRRGDADRIPERVDGVDDVRLARPGGEGELLHAVVARHLDGDRALAAAAVVRGGREVDLGGLSRLEHGHVDVQRPAAGKPRRVDAHVGQRRRHAFRGVVEAAVEQLGALEARVVGQAVDRLEDGVDLELVGVLLLLGQAGLVGAGGHQALQLHEQVGDLLETTLGHVDHLLGALRVGDGRVDGLLLRPEVLAGDEAGRVVLTAVDAQARAQALEVDEQPLVLNAQHPLSDHGRNVRVD